MVTDNLPFIHGIFHSEPCNKRYITTHACKCMCIHCLKLCMSKHIIPERNVAFALHKVTHGSGASSCIHHEHCVHKQLVCLSSTVCSLVDSGACYHPYSTHVQCRLPSTTSHTLGWCCNSDAKVRNTLCPIPCHIQSLK